MHNKYINIMHGKVTKKGHIFEYCYLNIRAYPELQWIKTLVHFQIPMLWTVSRASLILPLNICELSVKVYRQTYSTFTNVDRPTVYAQGKSINIAVSILSITKLVVGRLKCYLTF